VVATHDIPLTNDAYIPRGTPGLVVDSYGWFNTKYTVEFRVPGLSSRRMVVLDDVEAEDIVPITGWQDQSL
jgi:hypothetical protein